MNEGFLFANHLRGRDSLNVHVHEILLIVAILAGINPFFIILRPESFLVAIALPFLLYLEGIWFLMVDFIFPI